MKLKNKLLILCILSALFFIVGCASTSIEKLTEEQIVDDECAPDTYYKNNVEPILIANCALSGCHDAITSVRGYNYFDYCITVSVAKSGDLLKVIRREPGVRPMPFPPGTPPLSDENISIIETWVGNLD